MCMISLVLLFLSSCKHSLLLLLHRSCMFYSSRNTTATKNNNNKISTFICNTFTFCHHSRELHEHLYMMLYKIDIDESACISK